MNNFEKRLFLDYMSKLLNELDIRSYSFGELIDFFLMNFIFLKRYLKLMNMAN